MNKLSIEEVEKMTIEEIEKLHNEEGLVLEVNSGKVNGVYYE